ncbi:MAG: N-acetyl-gamma-glutamyl-phosphate reductase [Verrucomicrobia bacterium]|nr:N-acetyl-gamma-glutamyl-phosphate reductase [Verrucomicrobiota bacterium]MBR6463833.1 N-acetyl-gamma-glutamyl-phosphate reductase [Verrucomicrobiota bacterium]
MTKVAIAGASGYSGEELVRLLLRHPEAEIVAVTSRQYAGKTLAEVFPKFAHYRAAQTIPFILPDAAELARLAEYVFLALPHGVAAELAVPLLKAGRRVLDLSADFRLRSAAVYEEFYGKTHPAPELLAQAVYGQPETYREKLKGAGLVACAGCYPTSILVPTLPLLRSGLIRPEGIIADSLSGVTGAGRKADLGYIYCECNESARPYGLPKHRHLSEIEQELSIAAGTKVTMQFTPHLIPLNRGILTTLYLTPSEEIRDAESAERFSRKLADMYQKVYGQETFVRIDGDKILPDIKNIVMSNVVEFGWKVDCRTGRLIVVSAIDNLMRGASGQAIQCFNLMAGYPETTGLL